MDEISSRSLQTARPAAVAHPLGPLITWSTEGGVRRVRVAALGVLLASGALLTVAAILTPDSAGLGSHRQLGLPPCSMVAVTGYPCPTCGMTTAFAHTVRGQLLAAFEAQPAGLLAALATIVIGVLSVITLVTGRSWQLNWYRIAPGRAVLAVVLMLLAGWGYKIAVGVSSGAFPIGR